MLWYTGIDKVANSLRGASIYWLFLAFLASFLPFIVRAWRWKVLLSPVKDSVKYSSALGAILAGFLANTLLPVRVGEFLRAFLIQRRENVGFFQVFSSVVVERLIDLLSIVTLGTVALLLLPPNAEYSSLAVNSFRVVGVLSTIAMVALFIGIKRKAKLMGSVKVAISKFPMPSSWKEKLYSFVGQLIEGAEGISYSFFSTVVIIVGSLALWGFTAFQVYILFRAFSLNPSMIMVLAGAMLFYLSFALPAPPGYAGSFEAFWSVVFVSLGIPMVEALSTGIVAHLISLAFIALTGGAAVGWYGISFKELSTVKRQLPYD
jgi:hypothetical protein